jgi:hypothetical protein
MSERRARAVRLPNQRKPEPILGVGEHGCVVFDPPIGFLFAGRADVKQEVRFDRVNVGSSQSHVEICDVHLDAFGLS